MVFEKIRSMVNASLVIFRFSISSAGKKYGVGFFRKLQIALRFRRNTKVLKPLTTWKEHLIIAEEILNIDPKVPGDVVECGCFNGGSTANLSIICAITGRRLFVCDSFEGLPKSVGNESFTIISHDREYYDFKEGDFTSEGGLEGVRKNVARWGRIDVCHFVKGYFEDTLNKLKTESIVCIFEDADLRSSVETCLRYLWPKLREGCKFFCEEPWSVPVVSLFYDGKLWESIQSSSPPGFYGSGRGVVSGLDFSGLGFAVKSNPEKIRKSEKRIVHLGCKGYSEHERR